MINISTPIASVLKTLRNPLYRNGYALILSTASTSVLGLLYWALAARLYPPEIVGTNSAILSAMMFISGGTLFGLNSALVRFLPVAGRKTTRLVILSYLISVVFAFLVALLFFLGLRSWAPTLQPMLNNPLLILAFLLTTIGWSVFNLQDSVLTGLRQAVWVPLENVLFSITKIIFLLYFARTIRDYGVFFSWSFPVLLTLGPINWLIFRRLVPRYVHKTVEDTTLLTSRPFLNYVTGNYISSLFFLAYTTLPPLLVTKILGATANAYFYLPWTITSALFLVAVNMTTSMTVEASRDQQKLGTFSISVFTHTLKLIGPVILVIFLGADIWLRIFGKGYAHEGATLVRLLTVSAIPHLIISIFWSRWRVQNRVGNIILTQAALCGGILGLSILLLPRLGISGVGIAWLSSYFILATILILPQIRIRLQRNRQSI